MRDLQDQRAPLRGGEQFHCIAKIGFNFQHQVFRFFSADKQDGQRNFNAQLRSELRGDRRLVHRRSFFTINTYNHIARPDTQRERLAVPLDFDDLEPCRRWAHFDPQILGLCIGLFFEFLRFFRRDENR